MSYYIVGFGLLLHLFFWGAGLAIFAMPRPWRRFWPVLAAPAGCALQSLAVWLGAYANLPGTDSYAGWAELIPAVLLIAGLRRRAFEAVTDLFRLGAVWAVVAASLAALLFPLTRASHALTTASLGSCDAADYAAGARVLMEFARGSRLGFLGLTEVVRIKSVDNFFDFWLRLNHFTPSALIALNGTIFGCAPYQLTGILTAVLFVASVPVAFWVARAALGYRRGVGAGVAALYAFCPLCWYGVYHVAIGQLLAATAIALISWAGIALWRGRLDRRRALGWAGLLAVAYSLVWGSYNFIVVVCLVPALAYAGGLAAWENRWRRFGCWLAAMLLPLAATGALWFERVAGLVERFQLFRTYDFGWPIPLLSPEGWLGMVMGPGLMPLPSWARLPILAGVLILLGAAFERAAKFGRRPAFVAACLTVPALLGYLYLNLRGVLLGTHASYDAYKLLFVFFPGMLPALCLWAGPGPGGRLWRPAAWALAAVLAAGNLHADGRFIERMIRPPLIVDHELTRLRSVETMPQVDSVNLRIPDMWSRLWANAFLLRLPQYFPTATYEGRRATPLRGEWDLNGSTVSLHLPGGDSVQLTPRYSLVRVGSPYFLRASLGAGWYPHEHLPFAAVRWHWTGGSAFLMLQNPHPYPLRVDCRFAARSVVGRDLEFWLGRRRLRVFRIGRRLRSVVVPQIVLPPGASRIMVRSSKPPTRLPWGDTRALAFAAYSVAIYVQPNPGGWPWPEP